MGKFAYDHDYKTLDRLSVVHYDDYNDLVKIMATSSFLLHFVNMNPESVKYLPYYDQVYKTTHRIYGHLQKVLQVRRDELALLSPVEKEAQTDVLARMLISAPDSYTDIQIVWEMLGLFSAAHDSTAASIAFAMYHLAKHPEWQELVRAEGKQFLDKHDLDDDLPLHLFQKELPFLHLVMLESWRLLPPASGTLSRQAAHDHVYLRGIRIPRGVSVASSIVTAHHSKDIWGNDADEFQPFRFCKDRDIEQGLDSQLTGKLITFGCGRRSCLGQQFATTQNFVSLVKIVSQFQLDIPEGSPHTDRCIVRAMVPMTSPVDLKLKVTRLS